MSFPLAYIESNPRPASGLSYVSPYQAGPIAPKARIDDAPITQLGTQQVAGYTVPRYGVEPKENLALMRTWGDDVKGQAALTGSYVVPDTSNFGGHGAMRDTMLSRALEGAAWQEDREPAKRDPDERLPGAQLDRARAEVPLDWSRIEASTPQGPVAGSTRMYQDRLAQQGEVLALK